MNRHTSRWVACGAVAVLAVLGRVGPAVGQVTWDNGGGDNLWSTADNWSDNQVPTTSTTIQLNQALTGGSSILLPAGGTFTAGTAQIYQDVTGAIAAGTTTVTWQKTGEGANPQLTITSGLGVGNGSFSTTTTPYTSLNGDLVTDGVDLTVGSAGQRATMLLGERGASGNVNGATVGRLQVTNGRFTGYLSSLTLGGKVSPSSNNWGRGTGVLDLSAATNTTVLLDISGDARIAAPADNSHNYPRGDLLIRSGSVAIDGTLHVSRYDLSPVLTGTDNGRIGNVTVTDTPVAVSGTAVLGGRFVSSSESWKNATAVVTSNVAGKVSGLDLTSSSASALTISAPTSDTASRVGAYNRIAVNFQADPGAGGYDSDGWYWGFRWTGDKETTLEDYISGSTGMLQISGTGLSAGLQKGSANDYVTYDAGSNKTYVGITLFGGTQAANLANVANSLLRLNNTNRSVGGLEGLAGSAVELGSGTLTLGSGNQEASFAGEISGSGGLVKQGTGVQSLGGANSYLGLTDVTAGGLLVDGSVAGNVAVAELARLGGSGSLGGSLSLASGARLVFDPASPGLLLAAADNVSFTDPSSFTVDSLVNADGSPVNWADVADGTYTLLRGTTTSFANLGNFGPGPQAKDLGGGRSAYFADGSLQLVVVPEPSLAALAGLGLAAAGWALSRRTAGVLPRRGPVAPRRRR